MIIIDIDMPKCCQECPMRQKGINTPSHYCMVGVGRKLINDIYNSKANFCPIKCDFDDIKQEIKKLKITSGITNQATWNECLHYVLKIIDEHMNEGTDADSN